MPSGPHQQFCAQGFLSCFSCLCIACVQTSPISFVAGNCLYSLRNKRFRVVSEQRKTEERRGTRFSVCPCFMWSLTLVPCQCLVLCSEANGHDAVIIINNSKRDSCSGCMLLFTCFFIYGFFPKPLRPSAPQRRFNSSTFSLFQYFARIARVSNRGGTGN